MLQYIIDIANRLQPYHQYRQITFWLVFISNNNYYQLAMTEQTQQQLSSSKAQTLLKIFLLIKLRQPVFKWKEQYRHSRHRYNVLNEWWNTERTYIHDLTVMRDKIKIPLQTKQLITKQQSQKILFPGIQSMIELSNNMLSYIEQTINNWNPLSTMIGDNIKYFHKFFIIYREYCNNYAKGQTLLNKIKKDPAVVAINQDVQKEHNLDIESFIIKPVQRPTKYQLLLRDYLKKLPKNHADYKPVEKAMQLYHNVNEENNQSMHQQQRSETMINLDKKFGGIISSRSGRQYLTQIQCKINEYNCLLYAFNDMLILTKVDKLGREHSLKRIQLDGSSFVTYKKDNKYYQNLYFLCGCTQSIHLTLPSFADGTFFCKTIQNIIDNLYKREEERRQRFRQRESKRKQKAKFRVSKWYEQQCFKVQFKPKFMITVIGSAKEQDVLFLIQFAMIRPFKLKQHLMIPYKNIVEIKQYLRKKYRQIHLPDIEKNPQNFGVYEALKNSTKIIQYRSQILEQFLNFFFRNEQFHQEWKAIALGLGVTLSLYNLAISEHYFCNCENCIEGTQSKTLQECMQTFQKVSHMATVMRWETEHSEESSINSERHSYFSMTAGEVVIEKDLCSTFVFKLMQTLTEVNNKSLITSFKERMFLLQSMLGSINYSLLEPQFYMIDSPHTLRFYLMTIKEEFIDITLNRDKYVREILEEISTKNALGSVFDWGLFLLYNEKLIHIGNDEKIFEFAKKLGIQLEAVKGDQEDDSFEGFGALLKWGQQLFESKKGRLFFKKYIYFEPQMQLEWCKQHKQRYSFLVNTLFGRIRYQKLSFCSEQTVKLCALYLAMTQFHKLKRVSTITLEELQPILHKNYDYLIGNSDFQRQLFQRLKRYDVELSSLKNQRNAIELLYIKTLYVIRKNQEWITTYHPVKVYNTNEQAFLGVSFKQISVVLASNKQSILVIPLEELKYKATTFSLFFNFENNTYRFDSHESWNIKELIDIYLIYRKIFIEPRNSLSQS